jgi:tryptophan synthase alpha chain
MGRIAQLFDSLSARRRAALVPFLTAGDPAPGATVPLMHAMVEAGADMIELGIPFSDPMADGPVIQQASERALAQGVHLADVLGMVAEFRAADPVTPVILMGYLNPIEAAGHEAFAAKAGQAGADGLIVVDLPPEEGEELNGLLRANGIDPVFLLAPTTDRERTRVICEAASGFIYYVSLRGVTGAANLDLGEVRSRISAIKQLTGLPVGVGFGISDAETAARMAEFADAIIVGSAVVRRIAESGGDLEQARRAVTAFIRELRQAIESVTDNRRAAGS